MTIQQILYVLEVASLRSVSQAAQRLYISQSALSQQLRRLEEELGYSLFTRSAHGLELTQDGEAFCADARPVAEAWTGLCERVRRERPSERIRLRLGIGSRVYSNGLFPQIMAFFEANPRYEITLVTEAGQDVLEALRRGELDMALDRLPFNEDLADNPLFFSCPLIRERQCVLMSREDPRASRSSISVAELQGCTMMSGLEDSAEDRAMKAIARRYHISFNRVYRSDGIDTNMQLVREGVGVAVGPESFGEYYHVAAVPLAPEMQISLQFICLKSSLKRQETRQFRDYLLAVTKDSLLSADRKDDTLL